MLSRLVSICTLAVLSLCPWTSSASPAYPHQGITFARRQVPTNPASSESCYPLLLAEAEQLPAWGKVKQYIDAAFGEGVQSIRLNDPEHPDETAESCLTGSPLPLNYEEQPTCTTSTVTAKGIVDDVKHTVTFVEDIGVEDKLSWTVTTAAVLVQGVKVNVNYEYPGLRLGAGTYRVLSPVLLRTSSQRRTSSFHPSLSRSLPLSLFSIFIRLTLPSDSFDSTTSTIHQTKFSYVHTLESQCKLEVESKSCSGGSATVVPVTAKGVALATFDEPRPRLDDPTGPKSSTWFVDLNTILSEEDRTSTIELQGPLDTLQKIAFATDCVPVGAEGVPWWVEWGGWRLLVFELYDRMPTVLSILSVITRLHPSEFFSVRRKMGSEYIKRDEVREGYVRGVKGVEVPERMGLGEMAGLFGVWKEDMALTTDKYDELFMSKYVESDGNPRDFVWKGLLATIRAP
ncbi:hypothetical protein NMY22_g16239 [Coprinellus aureogranulatus]|nr:hypothetical protein NMY22_g16239 [Coprinellus aureogranulatus]